MSWQQQRPLKLEIDLNQATFQAFMNCINSFQGLETESEMRGGGGITKSKMTSRVSMERFVYNLGILDGIIGEKKYEKATWQGGEFDDESETLKPFKYWGSLVKWLKDVGFFKQPRRVAHF